MCSTDRKHIQRDGDGCGPKKMRVIANILLFKHSFATGPKHIKINGKTMRLTKYECSTQPFSIRAFRSKWQVSFASDSEEIARIHI